MTLDSARFVVYCDDRATRDGQKDERERDEEEEIPYSAERVSVGDLDERKGPLAGRPTPAGSESWLPSRPPVAQFVRSLIQPITILSEFPQNRRSFIVKDKVLFSWQMVIVSRP